MERIWLASKSPRRQQLLEQMQVPFDLLLPDNPEAAEALEAEKPNEAPDKYVVRVTLAKLAAAQQALVAKDLPQRTILTADTTVALGGRILGKPADATQSAMMLQRLSGRTHRVLTAVAVTRGNKVRRKIQVSRVTFARLKPTDIENYVRSNEGLDKAGGYAVQGLAARYIRRIEGSYSSIMGLPVYETWQLLSQN